MTVPDPATTLRALEALATDPTAPDEYRTAARAAVDLIVAGRHVAGRWGGKRNAETRADLLMPSTVRGAPGRHALFDALDELTRRCAS